MVGYFRHKGFINLVMLLRIIGWLLLVESAFMLVPLITAICYKEPVLPTITSSIVTAFSGFAMMSLRPRSRDMGKREAILLTAMVWVIFSLFGMLPFILGSTKMGFTDAFFETMDRRRGNNSLHLGGNPHA